MEKQNIDPRKEEPSLYDVYMYLYMMSLNCICPLISPTLSSTIVSSRVFVSTFHGPCSI